MDDRRQQKQKQLGIKTSRRGYNKRQPLLEPCEHCKCRRYNPCTCQKKSNA